MTVPDVLEEVHFAPLGLEHAGRAEGVRLAAGRDDKRVEAYAEVVPGRPKAVKWASFEAAGSSTWGRGHGGRGQGPPWECRAAQNH